ncbi:hypothetical protein SteCoe_20399 [Stentor coeruleus]|uniref:General transcription factor IIH subunit 3 n=1 Tax=Stentor coeruleus TaxID=5963 RepID=A0A1R2BRU9_9CILI|nr:hypothetical protein SteCoe_20399 [Stentor coeruleus]
MAQNLIVILDAIKSHWEVQQSSFIDANTQTLTLPLVINALKALSFALKIQHSENYMQIYIATGNTLVPELPENCKAIQGTIWKATARALCYINSAKIKARILVIQKSVVPGEQDIALNLMIAAQQLKTEIDGLAFTECEVLAKTSAFSGGVFMRQNSIGILQTLLQVYLPINRPRTPKMHFKPYCNCCNKQVDRAYVCSSCLAIYCFLQPNCTKCFSRLILPDCI